MKVPVSNYNIGRWNVGQRSYSRLTMAEAMMIFWVRNNAASYKDIDSLFAAMLSVYESYRVSNARASGLMVSLNAGDTPQTITVHGMSARPVLTVVPLPGKRKNFIQKLFGL